MAFVVLGSLVLFGLVPLVAVLLFGGRFDRRGYLKLLAAACYSSTFAVVLGLGAAWYADTTQHPLPGVILLVLFVGHGVVTLRKIHAEIRSLPHA